jgi:hypothetical protein
LFHEGAVFFTASNVLTLCNRLVKNKALGESSKFEEVAASSIKPLFSFSYSAAR